MPDGLEGPPEGVPPGVYFERMRGEAGGPELERRRIYEEGLFLSYELLDPDLVVPVARELTVNRLLGPYEERDEDISAFAAEAVFSALHQRGSYEQKRLIEPTHKAQAEEEKKIVENLKSQGISEEQIAKDNRFQKISRQRQKTERVLARLPEKEEAKEWRTLHDEISAAVTLQRLWYQRERAQTSVKTYTEGLFNAPFAVVYMEPSEMRDLFKAPGYGQAAEAALKDIIDLHLEGRLRGVAEDLSHLKILQAERNINGIHQAVTQKITEQIGREHKDMDDFVKRRGILLAEHLAEATLLSVWLAIPRRNVAPAGELEHWEVVYQRGQFPDFGSARFTEGTPQDLTKLILFGPKYHDEFSKGFDAGPAIQARVLSELEYLSRPYLHDPDTAAVFMDPDFNVYQEGTLEYQEAEKKGLPLTRHSILEAWYFANKLRTRQGKPTLSLAEVLDKVPDGSFSYWVYRLWRQHNVLDDLLKSTRTRQEDVIDELMVVKDMRKKRKDSQVAFGRREVERELTKARMVAARLITWSDEKSHEMPAAGSQKESIQKQFVKEGIEVIGAIEGACKMTGFLNNEGWRLAKYMYDKNRLMTFNELREKLGDQVLSEALIRPPREEEPGYPNRITPKQVAESLEEVANARLHLEIFQAQLASMREEKARQARAQRKRFGGLTRNDIKETLGKAEKIAEELWKETQKAKPTPPA